MSRDYFQGRIFEILQMAQAQNGGLFAHEILLPVDAKIAVLVLMQGGSLVITYSQSMP
jgi:hypothetical protein